MGAIYCNGGQMNFAQLINMGGYGAYVWSAYGFVTFVLVSSGIGSIRRSKRIWRALTFCFEQSSQ